MFTVTVLLVSSFIQILLQTSAFANEEIDISNRTLKYKGDPLWGDRVHTDRVEGDKLLLHDVFVNDANDFEKEYSWAEVVNGKVTQVLVLNFGTQRGYTTFVRREFREKYTIVTIRIKVNPKDEVRMIIDVFGFEY